MSTIKFQSPGCLAQPSFFSQLQIGSLKEFDCFRLGVDAVGEEDGMDLLVAVDGDEQFGITGGQRARFSQVHYLVADLANPQHLASNTKLEQHIRR